MDLNKVTEAKELLQGVECYHLRLGYIGIQRRQESGSQWWLRWEGLLGFSFHYSF